MSCNTTCKTQVYLYQLVERETLYDDAVTHCQNLFNGKLLTVKDDRLWKDLHHCFSCFHQKLWLGLELCEDRLFRWVDDTECFDYSSRVQLHDSKQLAADTNFAFSFSPRHRKVENRIRTSVPGCTIFSMDQDVQLPFICQSPIHDDIISANETRSYWQKAMKNSAHALADSIEHITTTPESGTKTSQSHGVPGAWIALLVIAGIIGLVTVIVCCYFRRNRHLKYKWVYCMDSNKLIREKRKSMTPKGSIKYLARAASQRQRARSYDFQRSLDRTDSNVVIEVRQQTDEEDSC